MQNKCVLRIVISITLTLFCVQLFLAQTPPDLTVSDLNYVYDINRNLQIRYSNPAASKTATFNAPVIQEISAVFHNTGEKAIKKIGWQFIFYKDADFKKIKKVYTSKDKTKLSAGESIKLAKDGRIILNTGHRQVNIFLVEYTDGTIWNGTKIKD